MTIGNHIDETILELYALRSAQVDEQRSDIEAHLRDCAGCRETFDHIASFYHDVQADLRNETNLPVPVQETFPAISLSDLEFKYRDHPVRRQFELAIPLRIARWVFKHPYVSAGVGTGTLALMVLLVLLAIKPGHRDLNPSYARAKSEFLVVYNKDGEELWRKHIGPEYDETGSGLNPNHPERKNVAIDIDGDGKNEVISIFGWYGVLPPLGNSVIAFNSDGTERWRYPFHRHVTFGKTEYSDDYKFRVESVGDYRRDGSLQVIALAAHFPWIPNAIVQLNAKDGSFLGEYWHAGNAEQFEHKDIDGDGIEELLFAGKNSFFNRASLAVLDARLMAGHAPVPAEDTPTGIGAGTEKHYILFPASDLEKYWTESNFAHDVYSTESGLIDVVIFESVKGKDGGELHYYFDSTMTCVRVSGSNSFLDMHQRMEHEGAVTGKIDGRYYDELRKGVQYWDGDKFVNSPTVNRHYLEAMKKRALP